MDVVNESKEKYKTLKPAPDVQSKAFIRLFEEGENYKILKFNFAVLGDCNVGALLNAGKRGPLFDGESLINSFNLRQAY